MKSGPGEYPGPSARTGRHDESVGSSGQYDLSAYSFQFTQVTTRACDFERGGIPTLTR